ncbi:helix-turn-helix transcriptional regulator [Thalassococcus sp. CAU 1522]|uniref:Helix-turn-helix transcriptional regulator n=1 Tax=Thalassococcus arenae TaxID=2851652 RepID=A0ABS6NA80_9RHOB|nr:helix-turn-helix transcriptional regulator [Thalassococcus arenae]MBV2360450.1 helix-turn-helix transcriptional regulator [Thalassococcus arenae]
MVHRDPLLPPHFSDLLPFALVRALTLFDAAATIDAVWTALIGLGQDSGLPLVDYWHWNPAPPRLIRSTHPAKAPQRGDRLAAAHTGDTGALLPGITTALPGFDAAVVVPVRDLSPCRQALVIFGGASAPDAAGSVLKRHGWALQAGAQAAHLRHLALTHAAFLTHARLTQKHKDVLQLIARGMMDKQIAHTLGISFSAVRQRLASVQRRTGAQSRAELAALAVQMGLYADPFPFGDDSQAPE